MTADATDIEVYGSNKDRVGWNYAGVKCGRVHLASWAQAELPLAMDLLAGNDDVRPDAPQLLARALAVLPAQVCGRPRVRADAGYFDQSLAHAAVERGCDFAIAASRLQRGERLRFLRNAAGALLDCRRAGDAEDALEGFFELAVTWDRYAEQDETPRWLETRAERDADVVTRALRRISGAGGRYRDRVSSRAPRAIRHALGA